MKYNLNELLGALTHSDDTTATIPVAMLKEIVEHAIKLEDGVEELINVEEFFNNEKWSCPDGSMSATNFMLEYSRNNTPSHVKIKSMELNALLKERRESRRIKENLDDQVTKLNKSLSSLRNYQSSKFAVYGDTKPVTADITVSVHG